MLPELIYREEKKDNYTLLFILGFLSGIAGFSVASVVFPSELDIIAVVFGAIPLVYPLNRLLFEDEKENAPHIPEVLVYGSIFVGEVAAFFLLGLLFQDAFSQQSVVIGASGFATQSKAAFFSILSNNLTVYGAILLVATLIGSSGAFILTWNASVLGFFFSILVKDLKSVSDLFNCAMPDPSPLCYVPHSTLEMGGFIIAGVTGSLISAAVYREDFDRDVWVDYLSLILAGLLMVVAGALFEAG